MANTGEWHFFRAYVPEAIALMAIGIIIGLSTPDLYKTLGM